VGAVAWKRLGRRAGERRGGGVIKVNSATSLGSGVSARSFGVIGSQNSQFFSISPEVVSGNFWMWRILGTGIFFIDF
jgi:hypothetical protein